MTEKLSLPEQVKAVEEALRVLRVCAPSRGDAADGLEHVLTTMVWLAENPEAVREAYRLRNHPAVKAIQDEFPGAKIVEVKPLEESDA